MSEVLTADVGVSGPVSGTGESCSDGSYVLLSCCTKDGERQQYRISRGGAENLMHEISGLLDKPVPSSGTPEVTRMDIENFTTAYRRQSQRTYEGNVAYLDPNRVRNSLIEFVKSWKGYRFQSR